MAQSKQAKKIQIELGNKGKSGKGLSSEKLDLSNITGYNVKLRKKETIQGAKKVTLKNGKPAVQGHGSDGTKITRFIKAN